MTAPVHGLTMENINKSHLWLAAAALLAACTGVGASVRRPVTGSILDIIDTEHVERLIAARRRNHPDTHYQRNDLGESAPSDTMIVSAPEPEDDPVDFRKILKSSKNALLVTKKEYIKNDWCKTEHLVQKIKHPGCIPEKVINKFCYGQCNSFYIPKGLRPATAFKSCSFCRPKKVVWITVTLKCPGLNPPFKRKRYQKIKQCKCLPAGESTDLKPVN